MTATNQQPVAEICSASHDDAQFGERAIKPLCDISGYEYGTPLYAGAAPAAVAGPAPKGWRLVPATPTRDWIAAVADGGYEDCDCASLIADILSRAPAAPALEAPAAPVQHQGMTIAGNGAAELGKLMRDQRDSRLGVYPDGNPNSGQP